MADSIESLDKVIKNFEEQVNLIQNHTNVLKEIDLLRKDFLDARELLNSTSETNSNTISEIDKLRLLIEENSNSITHYKKEFKELQEKSEQNIKTRLSEKFTDIEKQQHEVNVEFKSNFSNLKNSFERNLYMNIFFIVVIVSGFALLYFK